MATIQQLLKIIPFGKSNSIHAEDIARQLNLNTGGNQVETRALIREAIQSGCIILSTPALGYWQSADKQEVQNYISSLNDRAKEISDRSVAIKRAWNIANPNNTII